jgi:hypothetical protein
MHGQGKLRSIQQIHSLGGTGPIPRLVCRPGQPGSTQIGSGGITDTTAFKQGEHGAAVVSIGKGLEYTLAYSDALLVALHQA